MKRILFTLIALFAIVNLAHGQTLSYNSPDPSSVILANKLERVNDGTDSVLTLVDLYMLKNFKADEDKNGFTCDDDWILRGDKKYWERIGAQDEIVLLNASCNNTHQWSFEIKEDYNINTTQVLDIIFETYDEDSLFHQIGIIIKPMENQNEFNAQRKALNDGALLSGEIEFITGSGFRIDSPKSVSSEYEAPQELPNAISLDQNYPNPFNPQTTITYQIDAPQHVRLDVFNAQGQRIQTLVDGMRAVGLHSVRFDAGGLPSGLYVYRLQTSGETLVRKMMLVR